jgi:hypothetical protein
VHINATHISFAYSGEPPLFIAPINEHNADHRLAHHNLTDVKALIEWNLVTGMHLDVKTAPDPICEPCLAGKMHANPFPSSSWRASRLLELVHSDMHKVPNHSFSGFHYWVTFINNYRRYCFVLPIQAKSDVFNAFKQFKVFAENQMERKIKTLRDGKGGEYMSNDARIHQWVGYWAPAHTSGDHFWQAISCNISAQNSS